MLDKKSFGERISRLRSQKAVSQQSLAQYLGIGKSAVSMMESGQRAASADILTALANYFDVPVDYLLGNGIYGQLQSQSYAPYIPFPLHPIRLLEYTTNNTWAKA